MVDVDGRLVGRAREQRVLLGRLRAARDGRAGGVLVFAGEAGIGKSALLEVARAEAADFGMLTLVGRAVPDAGAPEFWPWRRILTGAGLDPALLDLDQDAGGSFDPISGARFRTSDRTVAEIINAAKLVGALVVLDDIQWADGRR